MSDKTLGDTTPRELAHLERVRAQLAPDLEVLRPLGQGSVARVYLAREPALQRLVAVKVLRDEVAADAIMLQRFEREAQAVARINHPNVTSVYRVGQAGRVPFIVMEHIDGRTLADLLAARGPMPSEQVRRVLAATSDALAAAHRKGIVHRHVRPVNVMVEEDTGRVVLMDFGMAALLETGTQHVAQLTAAGVRIGDPLRMSPEQQRGEPVGPPADVYCLGLLGYELLLGGMPRFGVEYINSGASLPGVNPSDLMEVRPIQELRADVEPALAMLIGRCLASRPEQRPRASEITETLTTPRPTDRPTGSVPAAMPVEQGSLLAIPGFEEFVEQIKHRKTGRVAVYYIVTAIAVLAFAGSISVALPGGEGGAWHIAIILATIAGFPIALVLSWVFDITAHGIRRQDSVDAETMAGEPAVRQRWLPIVGLGLSVLVFVVIWWAISRRLGWI